MRPLVVTTAGKPPREPELCAILREVARANLGLRDGAQPVWGVRGSGYARELATLGVEEFVNEKLTLVSDVSVGSVDIDPPRADRTRLRVVQIPVNGGGGGS